MMPLSKVIKAVWLILVVAGWLLGCSQMQAPPPVQALPSPVVDVISEDFFQQEALEDPPVSEPSPVVHKVKWKRETLFAIAHWYTGSGNNWRRLAEANPTIKPKQLYIGHTILIPGDLLKTRQAMPAQHLRPIIRKKKPPPAQQPKAMPKTEPLPLYGPIHNAAQSEKKENEALSELLETID